MISGTGAGAPSNYFSRPSGCRAAVGGATGALAVAFAARRSGAAIGAPCRAAHRHARRRDHRADVLLDATEIGWMPKRGTPSLWPIRILTDFGKSAYVLWVAGGHCCSSSRGCRARLRGQRRGRCCWPGDAAAVICFRRAGARLAGEVMKWIVGRGRPFSAARATLQLPAFRRQRSFASLPSGHANTAFALAFAVSALWPRARSVMLVYAVVIALSRLVMLAHHPSDVVAGALVGVIGAMAVRYWFAARRLGFAIRGDGAIVPLRGLPGAPQKGCRRGARPHKKRTPHKALAPRFRTATTQRQNDECSICLHLTDEAVSIVVPVRNEAGNVAPLIEEIAAALTGDGTSRSSTSMTARATGPRAARNAMKASAPICARSGTRNPRGQSAAVRSGVAPRAHRSWRRSTATGRTIPHSSRTLLRPSSRAANASGSSRASASGAGPRLQEAAVAHRQRRARRDPARRHPRYRLRPESVPARRIFGIALFRWPAPLPAGAGASRGLRHRLCRRDRPAAPSGQSNYGFFDRLWVGIMDLAGVWWLIRGARNAPAGLGGDMHD